MEKSEIITKLKERTPIVATKSTLPFNLFPKPGIYDSDLIEITSYSFFDHPDGYSIIYYEWGEPYVEYSIYSTLDYNITWGFSKDDLIQRRAEFQSNLEATATDTLLSYLWDPSTCFDARFRFDVCSVLANRINKNNPQNQ